MPWRKKVIRHVRGEKNLRAVEKKSRTARKRREKLTCRGEKKSYGTFFVPGIAGFSLNIHKSFMKPSYSLSNTGMYSMGASTVTV